MRMSFPNLPNSRRKTSRVEAPEVRVYWSSGGRNDLMRVRNLSLGGMIVETPNPQSVGSAAQIDFLVPEGQIRPKAVVRHMQTASGMGLQFTVVAHEDRPRLAALLTRLRAWAQSRHNPAH